MHPYLYFINTLMIYAYSPYAPPRSVDRLALFICKPDRFLILIAIHCTFHNVTHFMCCTNRNDELSCDISLDFLRFKHNTRYNTPLNRASPQLIEVGAFCPAALVKPPPPTMRRIVEVGASFGKAPVAMMSWYFSARCRL